jgi:hypothetical protein
MRALRLLLALYALHAGMALGAPANVKFMTITNTVSQTVVNSSTMSPAFSQLGVGTVTLSDDGSGNLQSSGSFSGTFTVSGTSANQALITSGSNHATSVGGTANQVLAIGGGGAPAFTAITDALINSAAAIQESKLAPVTPGQVLLGNGSGVVTGTTITGDINVTSAGVARLAAPSVLNSTGSTIGALVPVYIKSDGSLGLAGANVANIATAAVGFTTGSIPTATSGTVYIKPGTAISGFSGLTPGAEVYLGLTAGTYTQSTAGFSPSTPLYGLGEALTASQVTFKPRFIQALKPVAQYTFTGNGSTSNYTLGQSLNSTQVVMVYQDGRLQGEGALLSYVRNTSLGRIEFTSPPDNQTAITVIVFNM